jgi:flagellar hook-basal body complex protein FliE
MIETPLIDTNRIQSMIAKLKSAASSPIGGINSSIIPQDGIATKKSDFSDFLKNSLDQVNATQQKADIIGQKFSMGDDSVNLSDMMIATQKANISFQTAVQVRNKLVSAYHDIISMSI